VRSHLGKDESVEAVCSFVVPGEDLGLIYMVGRHPCLQGTTRPQESCSLYVDGFQIRQEQDYSAA
jgi:hypothetical protein